MISELIKYKIINIRIKIISAYTGNIPSFVLFLEIDMKQNVHLSKFNVS